ncbi:hypothetical protein J6590_005471 [Homalodisca vitripennis]|nr:hypothetical protein J6590_005471 [Homalodisca vitripennis]
MTLSTTDRLKLQAGGEGVVGQGELLELGARSTATRESVGRSDTPISPNSSDCGLGRPGVNLGGHSARESCRIARHRFALTMLNSLRSLKFPSANPLLTFAFDSRYDLIIVSPPHEDRKICAFLVTIGLYNKATPAEPGPAILDLRQPRAVLCLHLTGSLRNRDN